MWGALLAGTAAFVATNIDDIFLLMLLFAQADDRAGRRKIVLGQYLGVGFLTAASLLGSWGLGLLPGGVLRLLGLVPIALGVRAWRSRDGEGEWALRGLSVLGVAALAVAGGGDNIGVYVPLFARLGREAVPVLVPLFALLCGLWCLLGARLSALPAVRRVITRHKGWLVPAVFVLLGLSILLA